MLLRRPARLRSLASVLALAVALLGVTAPSARAAAPQQDFERLIAQADAHADAGRHAQALKAYADAFAAMPLDLKVSGVGEFVALATGNAAIADYRARGDRKSLEDGRMVLLAFVGAVQAAAPATDPGSDRATIDGAKERLAELDALRPAPRAAPGEPPPAPGAGAREHPAPAPASADAAPDRSRLGLGLAVSGGVVALAGVGLFVAGARQVPWYEDQLAAEGWRPTDAGYDAQIDTAERVRAIDFGLGAAALVVGVGLGVTGAVLLAKRPRNRRDVALAPRLGRDRARLDVTLRF